MIRGGIVGVLGLASSVLLAAEVGAPSQATPAASDAAIIHALNRLTYGPRPGDVDVVREFGLTQWVERQLQGDRLPDPGVALRLAGLVTLDLSPSYLRRHYELPPEARKEIADRVAAMGDPSDKSREEVRREVMKKYGGAMDGRPRQVVEDLQQAKILRAIYSERQLNEILVDFWMNHFNVYADKGQDRILLGAYERDTIRPFAFARFEDLLRATAESPAMLFYLDNWLSVDPNARVGQGRRFQGRNGQQRRPQRGLNENYAREIMELHTLGVDGGYTQNDVTEVARCFTGWTVRGLRPAQASLGEEPRFVFNAAVHDRGEKVVLGHIIRGGGKEEGDLVIHILATHPSTATFVSRKLARRFVSDNPPDSLVARAAETFRSTDGDIRAVLTTIVESPEFNAPDARDSKVKTPLEFVVSAVRASGARVLSAAALARRVADMGMPLYEQQAPTGYKDTADAWVSTTGLLARLNFALDLAGGKLNGVSLPPDSLNSGSRTPPSVAAVLEGRLVPGGLSDQTRATLEAESGLSPARVAGLILGSPEFQRR